MYVAKFNETKLEQLSDGWKRTDLGGKDLWQDWKSVNLEYYEKAPGVTSSFHQHKNKQITLLFRGKMKVCTPEREVILGKLDSVFLGANEKHKMESIGEKTAVGLNIFVPGRTPTFWETHAHQPKGEEER